MEEVFYINTGEELALPKEIQDLIDSLEEQDPFEANSISLSAQTMVETCLRWLPLALEKAKKNLRLVGRPEEVSKKLLDLARQFAELKEKPSK